MARVAIHGFGRIGRSITKAALKANLFTPVSFSDIRDIPTFAALFKADSNYGIWPEDVEATDTGFKIGGRDIAYYNSMQELPDWGKLGHRPGGRLHRPRHYSRRRPGAPRPRRQARAGQRTQQDA